MKQKGAGSQCVRRSNIGIPLLPHKKETAGFPFLLSDYGSLFWPYGYSAILYDDAAVVFIGNHSIQTISWLIIGIHGIQASYGSWFSLGFIGFTLQHLRHAMCSTIAVNKTLQRNPFHIDTCITEPLL